MPRQNRVTPFGEVIATSARGTLMGNRGGCFHDAAGKLAPIARWRGTRWITCLLEFKGRHRTVMTPGLYTELFFLDEATALSAGHRPCAECRRTDFNRFVDAWLAGNPDVGLAPGTRIEPIDAVLHAQRVDSRRQKVTYADALDELPDGAFVVLPGEPDACYLLWNGLLRLWTPAGYTGGLRKRSSETVHVLTPRSTVNAIAAGYTPLAHFSAPPAILPLQKTTFPKR